MDEKKDETPTTSPTPKQSALSRYREKIGTPSFISQLLMIGWTALCALVFVVMLCSAVFHDDSNDVYPGGFGTFQQQSDRARAAAITFSFLCPGITWFAVLVPLGITALVTMRKGSKKEA
jgi:hypothetical protein